MPNRVPRRPSARLLVVAVAIAGALTALGAIALWPSGAADGPEPQPGRYVDATVTSVDGDTLTAELTSGRDRGQSVEVDVPATEPDGIEVSVGDEVVLLDVAGRPERFRYTFVDIQRSTPLFWLVGGFVVLVLMVSRWQGLRALVGLVSAGVVLLGFLVPALLRDEPALPVVLVAAAAVAFVALYLAHGVNLGTTVALAGTLVSLAATAALALGVAVAADLTGAAGSDAQALDIASGALDLRGLLVAGVVIGTLGGLGDVTVSQVSIVAALHRANPGLPPRVLYGEAIRVGRDHLASTVNTLVLAFAGASLPLLVLFLQDNQPAGRLFTREVISVEVVRMLVGGIGLVASAPVTTALAAVVLGPGRREGPRRGARGGGVSDLTPAHLASLSPDG